MPTFTTETEAVTYIFRSMRRLRGLPRGTDDQFRSTAPTLRLTAALNLLDAPREYTVVTGSKGKGSVTVITARLLEHLGHTVGTITSPHLITWRERVRVNGRAIPEPDFLRLLSDLSPHIDAVEETLTERQYFSPQGIFLALALRWFDEQGVTAAVLEVGRGGRYDDIAVVPNRLSLFTPIGLEHVEQLGPTLTRIAWHKAGVIKPHSRAYSVPQAPEVLDVLAAEAEAQDAQFDWIAPLDMGRYSGSAPNGMRVEMGRYGEVTLSLRGRYQVVNASLAVIGAGIVHARLGGIPHGAPEYVERIRAGLADITWPGRCQKLQDSPAVYLDGAINRESAESLVESLRDDLTEPVVTVIGVPNDKDRAGVYAALGPVSRLVILTETARNPALRFPEPAAAVSEAAAHCGEVTYASTLAGAVDMALALAGASGTVVIAGTQSIVADAIALWGYTYEQI